MTNLREFTESGSINDEVEAFHRKIEEGDKYGEGTFQNFPLHSDTLQD